MVMAEFEHDQLVDRYLTVWWRKTRAFMIYRFVRRADRLLELVRGIDKIDESLFRLVDAEIEHVITEAIGRPWAAHMTPRQRAIWDAAKAACPDRHALAEMIKRDKAVRGFSNVAPKQALWRILKCHLDSGHWTALGLTEHEARVWTKLRQISDELMQEHQTQHGRPPGRGHRCRAEHFGQIRMRILRDHSHNERVGRIKISTIEEYFGRCCEECRLLVPLDESSHYGSSLQLDVNDLPAPLTARLRTKLQCCVDRLDERLRWAIQTAYFSDREVRGSPSGLFGGGISQQEFERLRNEALRQLRICLGKQNLENNS